jgi:pyruvate dehydrogenase E2 component (dihydrolipoamide acetyltransferase)/2-oxoglutarate dehydrogenase E2 component (dihydrolipoamide succinyltransferase)
MPHEVIMPALGMAQDTGHIVAWHKAAGDAVVSGDVLFEVETDKATMEVEAQASGTLTRVTAGEGADVPVGEVIALIAAEGEVVSDDPAPSEGPAASPAETPADEAPLPEGTTVIMPTLGMAQDSGLLVSWLVEPGGKVAADDMLFEVETDKSTMEVPAGADGWLAAVLAEPGQEVPTGQTIAVISSEKPGTPVVRKAGAAAAPAKAPAAPAAPEPAKAPAPRPAPPATPVRGAATAQGDRILASPKARRLALAEGLDLTRLAEAGYPQPYHARDLDTLRAMPAAETAPATAAAAPARHLPAAVDAEARAACADWAAGAADLGEAALLAALAGAALGRPAVVAVQRFGTEPAPATPPGPLAGPAPAGAAAPPDLRLRDLRDSRLASLSLGPEDVPVLTLTRHGDRLTVTLECAATQLDAPGAVALLAGFADRLDSPLRHLL